MKHKILVSIIIRTKNEERWIKSCFDAIFNQSFSNFEIIVVDNNSIDKTIQKVKKYNVSKILNIDNYLPGKALNIGIEKAEGQYIVCLSAHCIPKNSDWLMNLVKAIEEDSSYAGVYGRQEPMSFSSASDKRDLFLVFGLDRKVQIKDSFFHNANSIIRKECWEIENFDNKTSNIEDRLWAKTMLEKGYKLLYEPEAIIYHYHGIHQNNNSERLENVVRIIEKEFPNDYNVTKFANNLNIIAIIPIRGKTLKYKNKNLLSYTIKAGLNSRFVKKVYVSTDSKTTAKLAEREGAICPFIRPKNLSKPNVNLEKVQQYSLKIIEEECGIPDLVVHMEETFPFRPNGLIDDMIIKLLREGHDTIIVGKEEPGWLWKTSKKGLFKRVDDGDVPRNFKNTSFIGLHGSCCITYPSVIRKGNLLGKRIGIYKASKPLFDFEIRDQESAQIAIPLLDKNNEA